MSHLTEREFWSLKPGQRLFWITKPKYAGWVIVPENDVAGRSPLRRTLRVLGIRIKDVLRVLGIRIKEEAEELIYLYPLEMLYDHSRNGTFGIRYGRVINIPREDLFLKEPKEDWRASMRRRHQRRAAKARSH